VDATSAVYLRIASLTIAASDYLMTFGDEIDLYRKQTSILRMTRSCLLFIIVRYASILSNFFSNFFFLYDGVTLQQCSQIMHIAPNFKAVATIASQLIMLLRTYAVSGKNKFVLWGLSALFLFVSVVELWANNYDPIPTQSPGLGNCFSTNTPGQLIFRWHYIAAVSFDAIATLLATFFLWSPNAGFVTAFARMMFRDGLLYFLVLTGANILNVISVSSKDHTTQASCAPLAVAATMVMSERIIFNMQVPDRSPRKPRAASGTEGDNDDPTPSGPPHLFDFRRGQPPKRATESVQETTVPVFALESDVERQYSVVFTDKTKRDEVSHEEDPPYESEWVEKL